MVYRCSWKKIRKVETVIKRKRNKKKNSSSKIKDKKFDHDC